MNRIQNALSSNTKETKDVRLVRKGSLVSRDSNSSTQLTKLMNNLKLRRSHSECTESNKMTEVRKKSSESSIMRFYCDENKSETGTPMGFFGLFNTSLSNDSTFEDTKGPLQDFSLVIKNQRFFSQLELTKEMFPDFPIKMLRALVLRFCGNFKEIVYHLMESGWPTLSLDNLPQLINEADIHFNTPYFFGNCGDNKLLSGAKPFTFYTYYITTGNHTQYFLKYKNEKGTIIKLKIDGPKIDPKEFPLLLHPLTTKRDPRHPSFFPILNFIN